MPRGQGLCRLGCWASRCRQCPAPFPESPVRSCSRLLEASAFKRRTGAASHDVGVHVDRVDGIRHCHHSAFRKELLEVAKVRLCAISYEDLVRGNANAASHVFAHDSLAKEGVALFGTVAVKVFGAPHLVHCRVQCLDNSWHKGFCHIANAEAYDLLVGVCALVGLDPVGNIGKEIALLQGKVV